MVGATTTAGVTAALIMMLSQDPIAPTESVIVEEPNYINVEATAYYNKHNRLCADGSEPKADYTLAGKREWLGKVVELYDEDYNYLGTYTFTDVGYGKATGVGESTLKKGKTLGDIECGNTIDIYMDTYSECVSWGRQEIYMIWKEE